MDYTEIQEKYIYKCASLDSNKKSGRGDWIQSADPGRRKGERVRAERLSNTNTNTNTALEAV